MTTSEPSRLDRIERLLENLAEQQARFQQEYREEIKETRDIVNSNARSLRALNERISETDAITRRNSDQIISLAEMIARFGLDAAADRRDIKRNVDELTELIKRRLGEGDDDEGEH